MLSDSGSRLFPTHFIIRIPCVKTLPRALPVRLAVVAAILIAGLVTFRWFSGTSDEQAAPESVADVAARPDGPQPAPNGPAEPSALETLGAPDDPLPPALPLPAIDDAIQSSEAADALARQVLSGTPKSLPALTTALQASGIAVVGTGDTLAAKPADPWQGMVMKPWEVRTALVMVLPERTVTFALTDVAAALMTLVPELKDAAVEQLIVQDLRVLAASEVPTRRFFARFVDALGRNAESHTPYSLLDAADPRTIRVDGLQASLIVRRLATDVRMYTRETNEKKKTVSFVETLGNWIVPALHAQGSPPCTLDERSRTIMDMVALGSQLGFGGVQVGEMGMRGVIDHLESNGFPGSRNLGTISAVVSALLAYAQFMATYAALEADVTMDAPPLERTKEQAPRSGTRRQLTATIRMNIGNAQILNCFRIMLNAVGQDFSLPNDGPVKGARVLWFGVEGFDETTQALHGGSEAIVQFVAPEESRIQGGGSASTSPVTHAVTGDDGKVQIGVEGRGQRQRISDDATEVRKSAKVRLQVALKGADLFGDLQEAAGGAAGGVGGLPAVPLGILTRMQWASVGHYRFPVTDWRDGPAEWTGTVTFTEATAWNESSAGKAIHTEQEYNDTRTLTITLTETVPEPGVFGSSGAMIRGQADVRHTSRNLRTGGRLVQCNRVITDMKSKQLDTGDGSGAGTAKVSLGISADGQYSITVHPELPPLTYKSDYSSEQMVHRNQCQVTSQSSSSSRTAQGPISLKLIQGDGTIDPRKPDSLSGRIQERDGKTIRTLTWDLQRR